MSASEPLIDVFDKVPPGTDEPLAEEAAGNLDAWLARIIDMTGGRDFTAPPTPSVDALLGGEAGSAVSTATVSLVAVDRLVPEGFRTRRELDDAATTRLAASITAHGVLEPLLVRPSGERFQVVAGARRLAAARLAGLHEVPVVVLALSDRDAMMVALVENLQREDISALDEADCYVRLLDEFGWTQDELARRVGRSRSHIGNTLRLLALPAEVKSRLAVGKLTAGHARALINVAEPETLAARVEAEGLSVRSTEALARRRPAASRRSAPQAESETGELERMLTERLGLTVRLQATREGGKVTIQFRSIAELDTALRSYGSSPPLPMPPQPTETETPTDTGSP
jgi:ParB family chromosome partitioning protein